jgi:sugar phosphate isomerase/epimerase
VSDVTLRRYGYDHVLSIEHEDALMSIEEGLTKAIDFLTDAIIEERPATPWWT